MAKKQVCIYLSDDKLYHKIKMFSLTKNVSVSKAFEDAIQHLISDINAGNMIYPEGGTKVDKN